MKHQGIIIAIIACIGLVTAVVVNGNMVSKRDQEFQNRENQRRTNIQKCIQLGTEIIEKDACKHYGLPYPCVIPQNGVAGVNEGMKQLTNYCQQTYGKQ